jgi:hypothetical protein
MPITKQARYILGIEDVEVFGVVDIDPSDAPQTP